MDNTTGEPSPGLSPVTTSPGAPPVRGTSTRPSVSERLRFSNALVWGGLGYGALALLFTLIAFWGEEKLIAAAFFVALASVGVGCVAGFLFGIPKLADDGTGGLTTSGDGARVTTLLFNTNLGQISDWVTKIVVGLGIAQFGRIIDGCQWLGGQFGDVFGSDSVSPSVAGAYGVGLVIAGVTISFLLMYMWTATRLPEVWGRDS